MVLEKMYVSMKKLIHVQEIVISQYIQKNITVH